MSTEYKWINSIEDIPTENTRMYIELCTLDLSTGEIYPSGIVVDQPVYKKDGIVFVKDDAYPYMCPSKSIFHQRVFDNVTTVKAVRISQIKDEYKDFYAREMVSEDNEHIFIKISYIKCQPRLVTYDGVNTYNFIMDVKKFRIYDHTLSSNNTYSVEAYSRELPLLENVISRFEAKMNKKISIHDRIDFLVK